MVSNPHAFQPYQQTDTESSWVIKPQKLPKKQHTKMEEVMFGKFSTF